MHATYLPDFCCCLRLANACGDLSKQQVDASTFMHAGQAAALGQAGCLLRAGWAAHTWQAHGRLQHLRTRVNKCMVVNGSRQRAILWFGSSIKLRAMFKSANR